MLTQEAGFYFIIINIIGAVFAAFRKRLHSHTAKRNMDIFLAAVSLAGGSFGVLLLFLLTDRKANKDNIMSRVWIACIFVIQLVVLLLLEENHTEHVTFAFGTFFREHKIVCLYGGIVNVITFAFFAADKFCAVHNKKRIRIATLLGLAFIGGSVGGLLAMYIFRHKTQKNYFTAGIPMMIVMQIAVIFYMMNAGA